MNEATAFVIKFKDNTYYGGYGKGKRKSLLGAQIYASRRQAERVINKSCYFYNYMHGDYSIVELVIKEKA